MNGGNYQLYLFTAILLFPAASWGSRAPNLSVWRAHVYIKLHFLLIDFNWVWSERLLHIVLMQRYWCCHLTKYATLNASFCTLAPNDLITRLSPLLQSDYKCYHLLNRAITVCTSIWHCWEMSLVSMKSLAKSTEYASFRQNYCLQSTTTE